MKDELIRIKNWAISGPYWLRGAKVSGLLSIAATVFGMLIPVVGIFSLLWFLPFILIVQLTRLDDLFLNHQEPIPGPNLLGWLAFIVFWCVIGACIGWLYGKFKNRKQHEIK